MLKLGQTDYDLVTTNINGIMGKKSIKHVWLDSCTMNIS